MTKQGFDVPEGRLDRYVLLARQRDLNGLPTVYLKTKNLLALIEDLRDARVWIQHLEYEREERMTGEYDW